MDFPTYLTQKGQSHQTRLSLQKVIKRYQGYLASHQINDTEVDYTNLLDYIKYLKDKGNSQRTQQMEINAIKHYYHYLVKTEQILTNPATAIQIKSDKRKTIHQILTNEDIEWTIIRYQESGTDSASRKRNAVMLSMLYHQGLRTEELTKLRIQDIHLRDGTITIQGSRRTAMRKLSLDSSQIYLLMDYLQTHRVTLLDQTEKDSDQVFVTTGTNTNLQNVFQKLLKSLQKLNPRLRDLRQIRATVISGWLRSYNIRKVQYMAGHRYVSSTEAYQGNDTEELKNEIEKYHPF